KYGSRYIRRAALTATRLVASRLKNQIPGFSSAAHTYVRTFSSRNELSCGSGSTPRARRPVRRKGVIPSQALPSCRSTSSSSGRCRRTSSGGTRQCAKRRSCHVCPIVQRRSGGGQGRCSTWASERACRTAAPMPSMLFLEVPPQRLLALDRLEQRLEVPLAEARRAVAL